MTGGKGTGDSKAIGQVAPEAMSSLMPLQVIEAIVLDLDGVITQTALLHSAAWKGLFDEILEREAGGAVYRPFDQVEDFRMIVDGASRIDGMRSFLESRGIAIPDGAPGDGETALTLHGLAKRKDADFRDLLRSEGVEIFPSAIELIDSARVRGLKVAVVSPSHNCREILKAADIEPLFDVVLGCEDLEAKGITKRGGVELFVQAADALGTSPSRAAAIEDSINGIKAAREGGFALVIGVDRRSKPERMVAAGADMVVCDVSELLPGSGPPLAHNAINALTTAMKDKRVAVFLDYDGTVTPIVDRPEDAHLSDDMRKVIEALAERTQVAFISGRMKEEVREFVGIENAVYAGSHGFDIEGPDGLSYVQEDGQKIRPMIKEAAERLVEEIGTIEGVLIEDKSFAIAIHYRLVPEADFPAVEAAVDAVAADYPALRKSGGKKVFELRPRIDWDKGKALEFLLQNLGLNAPDVLAIYIGDDVTDQDAFEALEGKGIGIIVSPVPVPTSAMFRLRDVEEVRVFLNRLLAELR